MWSASYHVTEETSRFILSTGLTTPKNGVYCFGPTGNPLVPTFRHSQVSLERGIADPNGARNTNH
jgi:hypothetical protein